MLKIKRLVLFILLAISIPITVMAVEIEDEYDELDYVWIEQEIEQAKNQAEIKIDSRYAVVYCRDSKTPIWSKNANKEVPMASTTKIMTAIVMLENISNLDEKIEICKQAANIGGSRLGLKTGDTITYKDLLYGLLLRSGNDAATQIAISVGGSVEGFANMMNEKAKEIGLEHTHFVTPHGLDNEEHYTTALELAIITDYALNIETFTRVVSTKNYTVNINGYPKNINNTNELLGYLDGVNGVKTGFTNGAGRCLVTSVSRNNFSIITVVLGADTKKIRTKDSIKLIEYTYKNYELVNLKEKIQESFKEWKQINEKRIYVYKGIKNNVETMLQSIPYEQYPVLKSEVNNIFVDIDTYNLNIEAPIEKKQNVGEARVMLNTTQIIKADIVTKENIQRKNIYYYIKELISGQWGRGILTNVLRNLLLMKRGIYIILNPFLKSRI